MDSGVKDRGLPAGRCEAKASLGERRRAAASLGALEKPLLNQVGLVDILECSGILPDRHGYRAETHRSSAQLLDDGAENPRIHVVQPELVDIEPPQCSVGHF